MSGSKSKTCELDEKDKLEMLLILLIVSRTCFHFMKSYQDRVSICFYFYLDDINQNLLCIITAYFRMYINNKILPLLLTFSRYSLFDIVISDIMVWSELVVCSKKWCKNSGHILAWSNFVALQVTSIHVHHIVCDQMYITFMVRHQLRFLEIGRGRNFVTLPVFAFDFQHWLLLRLHTISW